MADLGDLSGFMKDGSGAGPADLDWLDVDEESYRSTDELPKQNLDIVPELKALQHYVGSWDIDMQSQGAAKTKVRGTAKWILGGRFVEQTSTLVNTAGDPSVEIKSLMTYDPDAKAYRMWTFVSTGYASEAKATWDAKAKTMTTVLRQDGAVAFNEGWLSAFADRVAQLSGGRVGVSRAPEVEGGLPIPSAIALSVRMDGQAFYVAVGVDGQMMRTPVMA